MTEYCPKCDRPGIFVKRWAKKRQYRYWYFYHQDRSVSAHYVGKKLPPPVWETGKLEVSRPGTARRMK